MQLCIMLSCLLPFLYKIFTGQANNAMELVREKFLCGDVKGL